VLGDQVERDAVGGPGRILAGVRQGELEIPRGQAEREEPSHDQHDRQQREPGHDSHPQARGRPGVAAGAGRCRPEPLPGVPEQRRQCGQRQGHLDRDGEGGERAHDREEGQPGHRHARQCDDVRGAGEHHRGARGARGPCHRLLQFHPRGELIAVAGDDEEAVVDPDGQGEHEGEDHRGRVDGRESGRDDHEQHGGARAHERECDGHEGGLQRAEDHEQHDQGDCDAREVQRGHLRHADGEQVTAHVDLAPRDRRFEVLPGRDERGALLVRDGGDHEAPHPHGDDGGSAVVARHAAAERVVRELDVGDEGDPFHPLRRLVERVPDARVVHGGARRGEEHHRGRTLGGLGEGHAELVERHLRGGPGDGELVVEGAPEGQRQHTEEGEQRRPRCDHPAAGAVAGPREPVQHR